MKKRFHSLLPIFFLLSLMSFPEREVFSQEGKSFLWKVQSKTNTLYILGSVHFLKKEMYPLNKKIEDAFDKSEVLVVEANINDPAQTDVQKLLENVFY